MRMNIINKIAPMVAGLALQLIFTSPSIADEAAKKGAIPAKAAIAPVQVSNVMVTLPASGQKMLAAKLSEPAARNIESLVKKDGVFSDVVTISEETIPSSASIAELAAAGRGAGADVVILGKIVELEGKAEYGFRPSLVERMAMEISVYETATGSRLWHRKESVNVKRRAPISTWSEEMIEAEYVVMAKEDTLPAALNVIIPKLHVEMADYRPPAAEKLAAATAEFIADVDRVPRVTVEKKKNAFALVIGIESYRDLPHAEFTSRDAKIMKEYLVRVMGWPEENIVTLLNERATKGDIEGYLGAWLKRNADKDSTVFIYYAGHGAPNPVTGEAFLIPFDGNPAFPEATGIPLKKMYQTLADLQVKDVMVVMDSCFSGGGGRSVMAKGGRPIAISVENPILASNNIVVMTGATGAEISSSYPEKRHGLFTYFFLKGLQGEADINGDGTVSLSELYSYLAPQVKKIARQRNMEQTPTLLPGMDMLGGRASLAVGKTGK